MKAKVGALNKRCAAFSPVGGGGALRPEDAGSSAGGAAPRPPRRLRGRPVSKAHRPRRGTQLWLRSCFDSVLGRRRGSQTGPSSPGHARRPPLAFALSLPLQTWHLHLDVTTEEHLPLSPGGLAPIYGLVLLHPRFTKIQTMSKIETAYSPPTHDLQSTSASGARSGEPGAPGDAWGRRGRPGRGGG